MNPQKIIYIVLGIAGVTLGAIGATLPMLPTFPFLLLAAFCFGRSSKRLDRWFKGTSLYKNNLESYVKGNGMTRSSKIRIMVTVTTIMSLGFYIMYGRELYVPCVLLGFIWLLHILHFSFGVKKYVPEVRVNDCENND